ncbi:MAG: class I SAM-dependent methyltransferase [Chroococcus sp. CMT-3BRIN-NPC107]|jgi:ubiquinone/menaquinone biosynthesis C-methylase UbiE|nr:class I SAM-dependent methyltransferase [Chroococcus sp. CMT-3BRIN-NPC107]
MINKNSSETQNGVETLQCNVSTGGWYKRVFAWLMANGTVEYEKKIRDRKQALFTDLHGTILEIGAGTGANAAYYPTDINWIGVEPNPFMHSYLQKNAEKLGLNVEIQTISAEQLEAQDNSIDTVVSTLVLCSVPNLDKTLQEVLRVLKPGGRFLFIEHVAAPIDTLLRQVQNTVKPVWNIIGDGCNPNRETGVAIKNAGFAKVDYQDFQAPVPIVTPHIIGVATKAT